MKKYRITKITVRTREVVSVLKDATEENRFSLCPVCHKPLGESSEAGEKSAEKIQHETQIKRLSETRSNENKK